MYLPCKQQQFVQKYNQRWPKSPSVVATFAAVSEATESYSFMRHVSMFQHGQFTGPCLAKYGQDSAFFLPGSEQWLEKPINRWILGHPIYEKHIG